MSSVRLSVCPSWGKVACWSTKAAISLKRAKIDEQLLWRAYRNSPTLFRTVPSPTSCGLPFPKIGGWQHQPKIAIAIISGTGKATDGKFGRYIHRGVHPNKNPWKISEKRKRGRIQGLPKFFEYPLLFQERVKLRTLNLAGAFIRSIRQKPITNLGEKGAWAYPGTAQFLNTPYYLRNGYSYTNFKFCTHRIDRNKAHWNFRQM